MLKPMRLLFVLIWLVPVVSTHARFAEDLVQPKLSPNRLLCVIKTQSESDWLARWQAFAPQVLARYQKRSVMLLHLKGKHDRDILEQTLLSTDSVLTLEWDSVPQRDLRRVRFNKNGVPVGSNIENRVPLVRSPRQWRPIQSLQLTHPDFHGRGKGAVIAVIDSRFELSHPALSELPLKLLQHISFEDSTAAPVRRHGDDVVSLLWANAPDNQPPLEGITPKAELVALSVYQPWTSNLLYALSIAEQQGAEVINLSWLLTHVSPILSDYLNYLASEAANGQGIAIVVAAHPDPLANIGLASHSSVITVSATDHRGNLAYASWDESVSLSAPSYLPIINYSGSDLNTFSKTSASTAIASGVISLIRQARSRVTAKQLKKRLRCYEIHRTRQSALLDGNEILRWLDEEIECPLTIQTERHTQAQIQ